MEDPELEKIKEKKLAELLKRQTELKTQQELDVIDLNEANFDQVISSDTPTLVDFWAEWCGPCRMMHPIFTRLAKKYTKIRFARLNVDQSQSIAMRFGVQAIPTFIMFKSGLPADKMMGAIGEPGIHLICQKYS
ncbi:MAG: thioredoxin [Nitrosopumilaceae archaeon]